MALGKPQYSEPYDMERKYRHDSTTLGRSKFETDKGRIIHSGSFRRLQGKTQVFAAGERDFYRTRLTHSLEVAQLGRGMSSELEGEFHPDPDLVEAICLAHDIGHPPFGHYGEEQLHNKMIDHGGFGANPQNIRIATVLETNYEPGGFDLTRATLDGLIKYPSLFDKERNSHDSNFTYREDEELLDWVKYEVEDRSRKPIEGQIADWADEITYCVNDIEDTYRAGLLNFVEMRARAMEISIKAKEVLKKKGHKDIPSITDSPAIIDKAKEFEVELMEESDLRARKIKLKTWTSKTIKFLKNRCKIEHTHPGEKSVRYRYTLKIPEDARALAAIYKTTARVLVFDDPRVVTLEHKGSRILLALFDAFREDHTLLPKDYQQLRMKARYSYERIIADFVSGMTDTYAYDYYKRLFEPDSGSFYEHV